MEISIDSGSIEIDTDEIVEAVKEEFSEFISEQIASYFDYHDDKFSMSWMRMQERELEDLQCSTRDGACNHGQKVYRALFHVIQQFLGHYTKEQIMEMIGTMIQEEEQDGYNEHNEDEDIIVAVARPAVPLTATWDITVI